MTTPTIENCGIKYPILKCATAISAAAGANSGLAQSATDAVVNHMTPTPYPDWFVGLMALPWASLASMAAAVYTCVMLGEWLWKKPVTYLLVRFGWMTPGRRMTAQEWALQFDKDTEGK